MKKIFTFILGVGTMLCANAQMTEGVQARIYAYDLQQEETTAVVNNTTVKAYNFTFKTNTAATGTPTVTLFGDGLNDVVIQATATDNTNKSWTATVHAANGEIVAGSYNWKVTVSADPVTKFVELAGTPTYNDKKSIFRFYRSFGLCVDQSPESDYFGRIYAVHQFVSSANLTKYRSTGMYIYSPELLILNNGNPYSNDIYGIGESSVSGSSPADMCISEDGRLFMSSIYSTAYNVYYINPKNPSEVSKVFNNATIGTDDNSITSLFASDGTRMTGLRGSLTTYGSGKNTTLLTLEPREIYPKLWTSPINEFKIGTGDTWDAAPSNVIAPNTTNAMKIFTDKETGATKNVYFANGDKYSTLEATKNGFWGVQYYSNPSQSIPTLFYYSRITKMIEYSSYNEDTKFACNSTSTALAVNDDLGLVAYTTTGSTSGTPAVVMKYTENKETGEITSEEINGTDYNMTILGKKADAMSFDYAGNLYAITSNNETMAVYALPDALVGKNTRTTPAKSTLLAEFSDGDKLTSIDGINADANAPVEYYNLQGVKVESPEKGMFIKKQGSKTTKVVF